MKQNLFTLSTIRAKQCGEVEARFFNQLWLVGVNYNVLDLQGQPQR